MSNLRKLIASRSATNLGSVAEEGTVEGTAPIGEVFQNDESDSDVLQHFNQFKLTVFPVEETYDVNGLQIHTYYRPPATKSGAVIFCHHGAGSSAMTFCHLTHYLMEDHSNKEPSIGVFAYDCRGHGSSSATGNFSIGQLTADCAEVVRIFVEKHGRENSLYLMGHSLGGSVLTNYLTEHPENGYNIKGLVMLDIVEETAISAFSAMPLFIERRPKQFASYADAISWHVQKNKFLYNVASARISIPHLFTKVNGVLRWVTDLAATTDFWSGWFTNLSSNFVECGKPQHVAKLLMLAGHETLDTSLIIGQMQGKYQLIVFNNSERTGHFVQEDIPMQIGISLIDFIRRNDSPSDYMKNELGFVPKWGSYKK